MTLNNRKSIIENQKIGKVLSLKIENQKSKIE